MARRTSLSGDTLKHRSSISDSSQSSPHPGSRSPDTITTPPQPNQPTNEDENIFLVPSSQDTQPTASTSFSQVQPLQKRPDHFPPPTVRSHYRSHQTHHGQMRPSSSFNKENKEEPTAETSVVIRTATLVPSSPLLKSTVVNSPASEAGAYHYPQSEYLIRADPKNPYYTFQDICLIPNPIIRIYVANSTNPRMFSLQNISPDTLGLLLSVFISRLQVSSRRSLISSFLPSSNPF